MKRFFLLIRILAVFVLITFSASGVNAALIMYDLSSKPSSEMINGAVFYVPDNNVHAGTGVIDSFLRVQADSDGNNEDDRLENGYNSTRNNANAYEFNEKHGSFTHALSLSNVQQTKVTWENAEYYEFLLDINQNTGEGHEGSELLSLDKLEIYITDGGTGADLIYGTGQLVDPIYSLDTPNDDNYIKLNYDNFSGSGYADMYALIPIGLFETGIENANVVLYSAFGENFVSNDGQEEWAHFVYEDDGTIDEDPVPEPATLMLFGFGLLAVAGVGRKKRFRP